MEVALPLDYINAAAAREKSIRHGHPSTLHLWWARRSLAAARAVPQSWTCAWVSRVPGRFGGCFRPIGCDALGTPHFCPWPNPASKAAAGKFPLMAECCPSGLRPSMSGFGRSPPAVPLPPRVRFLSQS
ncbi:DUF1156 domain-containing protein [uncultured Thiohalocapsa sp.]|uniref:DUF1156 domain-containing protein n=1 Tax=uncultured Thiohalocapsa sp. TaxID=768990 RepID=UPI0025D27A37|nr:DUF1156 domain-containing protein [uncultured Thiohalocapsa sp.]